MRQYFKDLLYNCSSNTACEALPERPFSSKNCVRLSTIKPRTCLKRKQITPQNQKCKTPSEHTILRPQKLNQVTVFHFSWKSVFSLTSLHQSSSKDISSILVTQPTALHHICCPAANQSIFCITI